MNAVNLKQLSIIIFFLALVFGGAYGAHAYIQVSEDKEQLESVIVAHESKITKQEATITQMQNSYEQLTAQVKKLTDTNAQVAKEKQKALEDNQKLTESGKQMAAEIIALKKTLKTLK